MILRVRRGLEANRTSFTPSLGEPLFTTDTKQLYIGDGVTPGGIPVGSGGEGGGGGDGADYVHRADTNNPHSVTKAQVGLSNVPNTDFTAAVAANTAKRSYPTADQNKLAGIATGATANDTNANLRARSSHTGSQAISTITGLQSALDSKQVAGDYATSSDVTNSLTTKVDKVTGKGLSTEDYTTTEKDKLAAIEVGAQVNVVDSVAGKTGTVTLDKTDVGLGSVDNTADTAKPVSTAQQAAIDLKQDVLVSGTNLKTVNGNSLLGSGNIAISGEGGGVTDHGLLTGLGDDDHTQYHNDTRGDARYYRKSEVDTQLLGKSDTSHNHDSDYADIVHTHSATDLTATGGTTTSFLRKDNTWATPTDTTYSEISETNIENTSSSTVGLITGRRAEALMDNEASKARTLTNKTISGSNNTISNISPEARTGGFRIGTTTLTTTGTKAVTGLGFQPKLVKLTITRPDSVAANNNATISIGGFDAAGNQWAVNTVTRNGHGGATATSTSACILLKTMASGGGSANNNVVAAYHSIQSDGFTINITALDTSGYTLCYEAYA